VLFLRKKGKCEKSGEMLLMSVGGIGKEILIEEFLIDRKMFIQFLLIGREVFLKI
jgi:hypothetical protein